MESSGFAAKCDTLFRVISYYAMTKLSHEETYKATNPYILTLESQVMQYYHWYIDT